MKNMLLLSAALFLAAPISASAALITIDVLNNGVLVGRSIGASGTADFHSTSISGYDSISVSASGFPNLTGGDLSSTTLDVTSSSAAAQALTVEVFQTGIKSNGHVASTFTVNGLIGNPGPTTTTTYFGGSDSNLGTTIASHNFPAGNLVDHFGPVSGSVGPFSSDAQSYLIHFSGGRDQSSNDSIEMTAGVIPEPSTWALLGLGAGFLAFVGLGKKRKGAKIAFG